jgi:hypothetical protein
LSIEGKRIVLARTSFSYYSAPRVWGGGEMRASPALAQTNRPVSVDLQAIRRLFCVAWLNRGLAFSSIVTVIISRRMRWVGNVARITERRNECKSFVREPEGKRPTGRTRCRWEDNIKTDVEVVGCWRADWIHPVQFS